MAKRAKETYLAGAEPRALTQKEVTARVSTAASLVLTDGTRQIKEINDPKTATMDPPTMDFDFENLLANGQTISLPRAVGIAPTVLMIEESVVPEDLACE